MTIETGTAHQHPTQMIPTGATSPVNAANNPQLRYKQDNVLGAFNQGAIVGVHHPASTKNQNSRQFNLKRSMPPGAGKGGQGTSGNQNNVAQSNF